jgi:phosphatidylserine/phosphatidylglycerophosphate/cardiolipin synthase-like enzyme
MNADIEFLDSETLYPRVILETLLHARANLWIATANVKDCRIEVGGRFISIVLAFAELCGRGVEVRLLHSAIPSAAFLASLRDCGLAREPNFGMRRCPRVHFKALLVDDAHLHLGSANLTGAGLGAKGGTRRNFELGILTRETALIERVARLYHQIWEGLLCPDCGRRNVCYVPLEEPAG